MTATGDSIADRLAAFCTDCTLADAPDGAAERIDRCFVDTVGVTLAGASRDPGRHAAGLLTGDGPATVPGFETTAPVTDAAFVGGTAAHSLEIDDGSPGIFGHPSATLVPALLAIGEARQLSGEAVVTGYLAGFEAMCFLANAASESHYEAGWHSTSTLGTFGAAAATATALGRSRETIADALRIAASSPAGLRVNFSSSTKAVHAGQAARAGLTATLLATNGFDGARGALGTDGGFLDLYTRPGGPNLADAGPRGEEWAIESAGINTKRYPCCYYTQTAVVSALELARERDLDPAAVTGVTVTASAGAAEVLTYDEPTSGQAAKFSMHHAVAAAIADREVGFETFSDDAVDRADLARLRGLTTLVVDESLPYDAYETTLTVETSDETVSRTRTLPPGAHGNPLSADEFADKFDECATASVSPDTATAMYDSLQAVRTYDDVGRVFDPLVGR